MEAGNETRTRDLLLGKEMLYQLSYSRDLVVRMWLVGTERLELSRLGHLLLRQARLPIPPRPRSEAEYSIAVGKLQIAASINAKLIAKTLFCPDCKA